MNRAELTKAARPTKKVTIPEWGVDVTIRKMDAKAVLTAGDELNEATNGHAGEARRTALAREAIYSLVDDETGLPMFQDTPEDVEHVLSFSFDGLRRLDREIVVFNGLSSEQVEKNSDASL